MSGSYSQTHLLPSKNPIELALRGFGDLARVAVFFNPVYLPLIMHTWFGAMSIGGFIVASFFAIRGNVNVKFAWIGLWHGVVFLILQAFMGPWYLVTLSEYAPILYATSQELSAQRSTSCLYLQQRSLWSLVWP
jgi:cytochrome bd-type quinol oxidase subunit 1